MSISDRLEPAMRRLAERRHCPHSRLRGIYGDEINHTPGFRRLACLDCGRLLDGPVTLAESRSMEWVLEGDFR